MLKLSVYTAEYAIANKSVFLWLYVLHFVIQYGFFWPFTHKHNLAIIIIKISEIFLFVEICM